MSSDSGSASEEKANEENDFCILTLFSHGKESGKADSTTSRNRHMFCSSSASAAVNSVAGAQTFAQTSSTTKSPQEASTTWKADLECSYYATQSSDFPRGKRAKVIRDALSVHVSGEGLPEDKAQEGPDEGPCSQHENHRTILPGHFCKDPAYTDVSSLPERRAVSQKQPLNIPGAAKAGPFNQCTSAGAGDEIDLAKATSGNIRPLTSKVSTLPMDALEISSLCKKDSEASLLPRDDPIHNKVQKSCSHMLGENMTANASDSPTFGLDHSNRNVRAGYPNNFSDKNGWVSKMLQHGNTNGSSSDDSDTPMLDKASASSISPKDVIRAVGQQQFWKARTVILRQWQIFSNQVFELHKLIEVQHLLAEMPNILFDEERCCGTVAVMPDCDAGASAGNLSKKSKYMDKEHSPRKDVEKPCLPGSDSQPGTALPPVLKNDDSRPIRSGPCQSMPALIPDGMTAWTYPSLGTWPWMESMAAPAGVFLNRPFAETFSSGLLSGRAYGSAVPGSGSQIWPSLMGGFRFPGCEQRPEFPPDMHSRYGPVVASFHQWNPAMYGNFPHGPMAPDLTLSWYAMHCYHMNCNHGSLGIGNDKTVPLDLAESRTIRKNASRHTVKRSCCPGTQLHRGMNGCTVESDTEAMDSSVCQGQQYSLSVADGLNVDPAIAFCEKDKCGHEDDPEWAKGKGDSDHGGGKIARQAEKWGGQVIKAVPRAAVSASESAAGILLSIQQERHQ